MKAGRDLDALIATTVMGWEWQAHPDQPIRYLRPTTVFRYGAIAQGDEIQYTDQLPHYSTDISAAWIVVQNLRERGWFFDIGDKPSNENDMMSPRVWNAFVDRIVFGPNADTPMLAICLAALKAIEEHQS